MAAPTETYVDPSIAGDSGAGSSGDPYGDLQYALNTMTRDGTDGDRINIKAGTDEILAAALTLATYGAPTAAAVLVFEGYTSTAGDGGIGGISGNASVSVMASTAYDYIGFKNLHLHNCGSSTWVLQVDNSCKVINCEIDNCEGGGLDGDTGFMVYGCNIHNLGGTGIAWGGSYGAVVGCYFTNGANVMTTCIDTAIHYGHIMFNVMSLTSTTEGIDVDGDPSLVMHNSLFTTGTGIGIDATYSTYGNYSSFLNNVIEGFSTGLLLNTDASTNLPIVLGNAGYGNDTDISLHADNFLESDNESLGASPFAKSGSDTYALRATYFAPVDTGNVFSPYLGMATAKGAIQAPGGGGGTTLNMPLIAASSLLKR